MAPPKGYKKGYVKHPETGEWADPRVLDREEKTKVLQDTIKKDIKKRRKKKVEDDLGPTTKAIKDPSEHPTIIISWKDSRGYQRTTQYTMNDLTINESISEIFFGAKKKTHIHLSLDGVVLEKN